MQKKNSQFRFLLGTQENRLIFDSLNTAQRTAAEDHPKLSNNKQQHKPMLFRGSAEIFDYVGKKSGNTAEKKWEQFSRGKNDLGLYKNLFEGSGARLKGKVPSSHSGTVETWFWRTPAKDDAERADRIRQTREAFINSERRERGMAELSFDTDVQTYLDGLPVSEAWIKNPYLWFNPDKDSGETPSQRIEKVYAELFGTGSSVLIQAEARRSGIERKDRPSIEEMVFGDKAKSVEGKRKRLEIWSNHLTNSRMQQLETKVSLRKMESNWMVEGGKILSNIGRSFGRAKGIELVGMVASSLMALRVLYVSYKMATDAEYRKNKSIPSLVIDAALGMLASGNLLRKGTHDRFQLLDELGLTSNLDEVEKTGLKEVLTRIDLDDESCVRASLIMGEADLGLFFEDYMHARIAKNPEDQIISIEKLTNGEHTDSKTVSNHDAFRLAHATFMTYGEQYFYFATGRKPRNDSEILMGARLFVEYHKFSGARPSWISAVTREENSAQNPEDFAAHFKDKEGILARFWETAKALIQAPVRPIQSGKYLVSNLGWMAEKAGLDIGNIDQHISPELKQKLDQMYKAGKGEAIRQAQMIKKFWSTEWGKFIVDKKGYLKDVTDDSLTFVCRLGRDAVVFVYEIGTGVVLGGLETGGKIKNKIDGFSVKYLGGKPILETPFLPYWYDTAADTWKFGTLGGTGKTVMSGAKTAGSFAAWGAGHTYAWGVTAAKEGAKAGYEMTKGSLVYTKNEVIRRWQNIVIPKLASWGITDAESFGAKKAELLIWAVDWLTDQSLDKGGRALRFSGRQIMDVIKPTGELMWEIGRSMKRKTIWTEQEWKQHLTEWANKQPNIQEFNALLTDPAKEQAHFTGSGTVADLQIKAEQWLFNRFGWWNVDVNPASVTIDEAGQSITFNNFNVERTGIHTKIQGVQYDILRESTACSLKINFNVHPDQRFTLTYKQKGTTPLNTKTFGLSQLSNYEFLKTHLDS